MKNRQPYENLYYFMQAYNIQQVLTSVYVCYEIGATGWFSHYNWVCQPVELDSSNNTRRMMIACYVYFLNKFLEFLDTFFFIARKKFRNVNRLQLIHHAIMPIFTFLMVRWLPGGHETFAAMFNSFIHVIMYSYYFLAALGPHMQKYLWWKRYLTVFQMIQFVCIIVKSMVLVLGVAECGYPWQFSGMVVLLTTAFFLLFLEFYLREYSKKKVSLKKENSGKEVINNNEAMMKKVSLKKENSGKEVI